MGESISSPTSDYPDTQHLIPATFALVAKIIENLSKFTVTFLPLIQLYIMKPSFNRMTNDDIVTKKVNFGEIILTTEYDHDN